MLTLDPSLPGRRGRETLGALAGFEVSGEALDGLGGLGAPGDQPETLDEFWDAHRDCGPGAVDYERDQATERVAAARCRLCGSWFWGTGPAYVGPGFAAGTFSELLWEPDED